MKSFFARPWLVAAAVLWSAACALAQDALPGQLKSAAIRVGDLERTYSFYVPAALKPKQPLLLVLHGSNMDGAFMRRVLGGAFDRLAEREGFLVAYPDAVERNWNDCRKDVSSAAKSRNVDDVAFLRAVILAAAGEYQSDTARVFAFGYSGGAHAAYRLGWEAPGQLAAIAAVAANLPGTDGLSCTPGGTPPRVMVVNGTADPLNPYGGGPHRAGGIVLSSRESSAWLAQLHGATEAVEAGEVYRASAEDPTSVELVEWRSGGRPVVALYTVRQGGHTVPQPVVKFAPQIGPTSKFDAPAAAWKFFTAP